jgi:hypothetical protein
MPPAKLEEIPEISWKRIVFRYTLSRILVAVEYIVQQMSFLAV